MCSAGRRTHRCWSRNTGTPVACAGPRGCGRWRDGRKRACNREPRNRFLRPDKKCAATNGYAPVKETAVRFERRTVPKKEKPPARDRGPFLRAEEGSAKRWRDGKRMRGARRCRKEEVPVNRAPECER